MQSAYLVSILLFCSSLIILFMKSFYSNLSVSLVSDMKFSIDRNHMFLICNGILVILVKSSTSNSCQENNSDDQPRSTVINDKKQAENSAQVSNVLHHDDQANDDDDDDHNDDDDDDDADEDDGIDEDEDAEELNKRCEDFIRRMKQGIMSESRKDSCLVGFS